MACVREKQLSSRNVGGRGGETAALLDSAPFNDHFTTGGVSDHDTYLRLESCGTVSYCRDQEVQTLLAMK